MGQRKNWLTLVDSDSNTVVEVQLTWLSAFFMVFSQVVNLIMCFKKPNTDDWGIRDMVEGVSLSAVGPMILCTRLFSKNWSWRSLLGYLWIGLSSSITFYFSGLAVFATLERWLSKQKNR